MNSFETWEILSLKLQYASDAINFRWNYENDE